MRFTLVTLFPEFFDSPLASGLMGRGEQAGLVEFSCVNPRDFAADQRGTVDDRPYGGGPGMVMSCPPLVAALESIPRPGRMIYLSPRGRRLDQALARELAAQQALTLICGRYEGIDQRILELFPVQEVSVGDFVLNGGEAGALCLMEAVARLLPGFMGHEGSADEESFSQGLLEYPHYTRPEEFRGLRVPAVLAGGDHGRVAAWRRERALETTLDRRPDLLAEAALDEADLAVLRRARRAAGPRLGRNLYVALLHAPVLNKFGQTVAVSLTNLDVHDIARVSRTCGLGGYYVATPLADQRALLDTLLGHWLDGPGREANADRAEALGTVRAAADLDEVLADVARRCGQAPRVLATSARGAGGMTPGRVRAWLGQGPVVLVLGTGHGLAPEILERADGVLRPLHGLGGYNHLPVRAAAAMIIDRVLGDAY
ncbi:tRNA (guanosine(37)-N1)-methyltransferase TrmD [Desulfocurvus vexinensis]|uniref:tRNA (guanosine(37)-N1)-methyltransferase TrmD n=1 Tax=Desulfocurvus vexinensis TaxID=399548 RepID=UPI00049214EB|nr:tRNA (guanosine(37)-N1)-methyltransferase TrmD [Desulfocurvus vexinensis]